MTKFYMTINDDVFNFYESLDSVPNKSNEEDYVTNNALEFPNKPVHLMHIFGPDTCEISIGSLKDLKAEMLKYYTEFEVKFNDLEIEFNDNKLLFSYQDLCSFHIYINFDAHLHLYK